MRDALFIPLNQQEELVITSDNSGAIGLMEEDVVKVPYEMVSYFSFRVAVIEILASGATPISIVLQNFCGDETWSKLVSGIKKGTEELEMKNISITGSTESNFTLNQSAIGITMIGKRSIIDRIEENQAHQSLAVIGLPLVGNEVIQTPESIVPLSLVRKISQLQDIEIWPVGSKGILHELKRMMPNMDEEKLYSTIDLLKSGGPATSIIVQYPTRMEQTVMQFAGDLFHKLWEGEA